MQSAGYCKHSAEQHTTARRSTAQTQSQEHPTTQVQARAQTPVRPQTKQDHHLLSRSVVVRHKVAKAGPVDRRLAVLTGEITFSLREAGGGRGSGGGWRREGTAESRQGGVEIGYTAIVPYPRNVRVRVG